MSIEKVHPNGIGFLLIEIMSKKVRRNNMTFCSSKLDRAKCVETRSIFHSSNLCWTKHVKRASIFRPLKLRQRNYVKTTSIFRSSKLRWTKYLQTTSISYPSKFRWRKYVETTSTFRPSNLHCKSPLKWRGNLSMFSLQRIDVISPSNRRRFDVVCRFGCFLLLHNCNNNKMSVTFSGIKENVLICLHSSIFVYTRLYSYTLI